MLKSRFFPPIWMVLTILCLWPLSGQAAEILVLRSSPLKPYDEAIAGFNRAIAGLAAPPGLKTIAPYSLHQLDIAGPDPVNSAAEKIADLHPDLVVAVGGEALAAVQDLKCPIVYLLVANPDAIGGPRPNITGLKMTPGPRPQLTAIKSAFPTVKRIGLLFNPATSTDFVSLAEGAAQGLALSLVKIPASSDREAILLMDDLSAELDAIWLRPDPALISPTLLKALALVSLERRIPLLAFAPKYLEFGAAMAIYSSPEQLGRQAADLVKRLLSDPSAGATKPEDGREVTVLANERIIQKLGLTFKPLTTPEGQEAP